MSNFCFGCLEFKPVFIFIILNCGLQRKTTILTPALGFNRIDLKKNLLIEIMIQQTRMIFFPTTD